jgi:hypothetical protein
MGSATRVTRVTRIAGLLVGVVTMLAATGVANATPGAWSPTGSLSTARSLFATVELPNGRAMVIDG